LDSAQQLRQRGLAAARAGDFVTAQAMLEESLRFEPGHVATLVNLGAVFQAQRDRRQALACYEQALTLDPAMPEGWNNRSLILSDLGNFAEAAASAREALRLRPAYPEAMNNLGVALYGLGDKPGALGQYQLAIQQRPHYARALANSGALHHELGDPVTALAHLELALRLEPNAEFLAGLAQHVRMKLCDWRNFDQNVAQILRLIDQGFAPCPPFAALALFDDPARHRLLAERWAQRKLVSSDDALYTADRVSARSGKRIRIGYFSGDFYHHATSHLMAGLLEKHHRDRFEIFGFSFGPPVQDAMAERVRQGFDHFEDVSIRSDADIAARARSLNIDIAIDLKGYTQDSRANILAIGAAPIQVAYLGYPGTMGTASMHYLLADPVVVPPGSESAYSEKIIRLPDSYQVNDPKRSRLVCEKSRASHGLPTDAVVFACFNHTYKILPDVFASWIRILQRVESSVLWLLIDHPVAANHLRSAVRDAGIAPERLIFAPRVATAEHLARHVHADVFLDTFPYNAHTTASDALWMGLPVVTRTGASFASRVAASLLHAIGLPELVVETVDDYERLAIDLAHDASRRSKIRQSLLSVRDSAALFDLERFTRHIERAYQTIHRRHLEGLPVDHVKISP
jgi:predicted O-linked N-acetylglucosamine transferase (SPINDLY family)